MRPLSIKVRLSLLVSLLILAIATALCAVAYVEVQESLLNSVDNTLTAVGTAMLATLDEREPSEQSLAEFQAITGYSDSRHSSRFRIWLDGSESDLFVSDAPDSAYGRLLRELPKNKRPEINEFSYFGIRAPIVPDKPYPYRVVWIRHPFGQKVANVVVAHSSHEAYHEIGELVRLLFILGGSITLTAFLVTPALISWGMRPIERVSAQLQAITHRNLDSERPFNDNVPTELRPFTSSLDDMLDRLNNAMRQQERFTSDAAHELRTPLAIIKSTLQTLRIKHRTVAQYEEGIDSMLKDVDRMGRLTKQLLSLAQWDEMGQSCGHEPVRLDVLLGELAERFDVRAAEQGGRVSLAESPGVAVLGSQTELRQLFSNLLDNAVRHGPAGGTVQIGLQVESEDGITVSIHDEGGQISAEALPHLFDRFYRVDSSRSQASGGSGLGLAITREIVLRHHGKIEISSDPQIGTVVLVRLPRP